MPRCRARDVLLGDRAGTPLAEEHVMAKYRRKKPGPAKLPPEERAGEPTDVGTAVATEVASRTPVAPEVVSDERTYGLNPAESRDYPQRPAADVDPSYTDPPSDPATAQPRKR